MEMVLFLREYYGRYRGKNAGIDVISGFFMLLCSMKIHG